MEILDELDALIEPILRASRIPGTAIALVNGGQTIFARGYGYRDWAARLPMTAQTVYPIGSTTKALNATLLGMLVDEGRIAWDAPVQDYLPRFRLMDPVTSSLVTLRDLLVMRTGLPRHDYVWIDNPISREELVDRLRHLELSAGFREKFQYNNLSVTTAGHIAEVVTGHSWEELVRQRILEPLEMGSTRFAVPTVGDVSLSYHENRCREVLLSERFAGAAAIAPAGGAIHSTIEDMARWLRFNLSGGRAQGRQLVQPQTLMEIQSPQMPTGKDAVGPTPDAAYAMGWCVDTYNGRTRLSHAGYFYDVGSEVVLFPEDDLGIVCFCNFGPGGLARLISQQAFDLLKGFKTVTTLEEKLADYERKVEDIGRRKASVCRVENTSPSHPLDDYAGIYSHPGYGKIHILRERGELIYRRNERLLPLQHWHYDAWIAQDSDRFLIHLPHAFDRASRFLFETNADGEIAAVSMRLEPSVAPIRFEKR